MQPTDLMTRSAPAQHIERLMQVWSPKGKQVLDVGCGDGSFMKELSTHGAACFGLEVTSAALRQARANGLPEDRLIKGDGATLPFRDETFDAVVFVYSLHHVPSGHRTALLAEAGRILRPGGLLSVFEPRPYGAMTEVIKPIEDETAVRTQTQNMLEKGVNGFIEVKQEEYNLCRRIESVEALIARVVAADPKRATRAKNPAIVAQVVSTFGDLAQRLPDGHYELTQPTLHMSFERRR